MTGVLTSVAFALALLLGVGAAQAQTSEKLVSNTGQTGLEFSEDFKYDHAQAFTTGSHAAGYTLTRVDLKAVHIGSTTPAYTVSIYSSDSSNQPGTDLGTLTNPASLPSTAGLVQFTASDGIDLAPNTTYWMVVDVDTGDDNTSILGTYSDDEDTGTVAGWTIANTLLFRIKTSTGAWVSQSSIFKFAVHGYANPSVSNTGQTDGSDDALDNDHAQAFTTGSHAAGYTLTRVDLEIQDTATTTPTYSVAIWSNTAANQPDSVLTNGTLTNPASLPGTFGLVQFTASGGIDLAPNTTYWVVIDVNANPDSDTKLKRTTATAEDAGGATGWSIADDRLRRASTASAWGSPVSALLQLAVYGTVKPGVTDVALSSSPASDQTYGLQEKIRVQLTFNQAVDVTGTPRLKIAMGTSASDERWAAYESGSGTTMLTFVYTVVAADRAANGIAVLENTLALNSGTLKVAGTQNNVVLNHPGQGADPNHKVDGSLVNSSEVSIAGSATIVEGEGAVFTVTASPAPMSPLTVNLEISESDSFVAAGFLGAQTVSVLPSGSGRYIVATVDDTTAEANGTVTATLRPGTGYTVHGTRNTATMSVHDNDSSGGSGDGGGGGSGGNPPGSGSGDGDGGGSRVRDRHGDSAAGATPIAFRPATSRSSSIAGRINTQRDVDYFRLRLSQAGVLVVETNGSTDTRGNVWQAGEEMGAATGGGPGTNFRLTTPVEAGDVVIAVAGEGGQTGAYTLRARLVVSSVENPRPASFQSGLSVISGWVCEGEAVTIEIEEETGEVVELAAAYGTERADTATICGDSDNGFGLLFNWNLLGDGDHTVIVLVDGIELGRAPVTVTTLGAEFVEGLAGRFVIEDFPRVGEQMQVVWQESQQNFVLAPVELGAALAPAPSSSAIEGKLENPAPASYQSGVGVISGWVCEADEVVIEIDGHPIVAAAGTERADTLDRCGDTDNSFGLLVNWAEFGAGEHEVVALVDGVELSRATVTVTLVDEAEPFVRGLAKRAALAGFPTPEETVTLEWQQSQQNFVITGRD